MQHPVYASELTVYATVNRSQWHCPPHAHQCFELLYVLEGNCRIVTSSGTAIARPNHLVLFRPYQWHEETMLSSVYAVVCLRFPSELLSKYQVPLPGPSVLPTVTPLPHTEAFRSVLERLVAEYQQDDEYTPSMVGTYLFQFAVLLQRALRNRRRSMPLEAQVEDLQRLLDQHITSALPIRDLARQIHMSESHFCHQVKALLGVAPQTYVREQRIARAMAMLRSSPMRIEEIAIKLGYDEPTSFFRAFKRATGMTPGEYRQQTSAE